MVYPNNNQRPRRSKYAHLDRFDVPRPQGANARQQAESSDPAAGQTPPTAPQQAGASSGVKAGQASGSGQVSRADASARSAGAVRSPQPQQSSVSSRPPRAERPVPTTSSGPRAVQDPAKKSFAVDRSHAVSDRGSGARPARRRASAPLPAARRTSGQPAEKRTQASRGNRGPVTDARPRKGGAPVRVPRKTAAEPLRPAAPGSSGKSRRKRSFPAWLSQTFRTNRVFALITIIVLVLGVAGLIDAGVNHDKIYTNVSIGEVDVSGMTQDEAAAALEATYGSRITGVKIYIYADEDTMNQVNAGKKIDDIETSETVSVEEAAAKRKVWKTSASTLQARMEYANLARQAYEVGRSDGSLGGRLSALFFGRTIEPMICMNDNALKKLASSITDTLGNARQNYGITVADGTASVTEGHDGNEIDLSWLQDQLQQRFLDSDNSKAANSFVAEIAYAPLQITADMAQKVADQVNTDIAPGATFSFGDHSWTASATDIGDWITSEVVQNGDSYQLALHLDTNKARTAVLQHIQPKFSSDNVKVAFQKDNQGNITVHTSEQGDIPIISDAVATLEHDLFDEGADHSQAPNVEIQSMAIPDSMSVEDALNYGIISVVSSYQTEYTAYADERNHNIHLAADLLNNSIITANGGQWSFNKTAGECNAEKGFQGAGVIIGGETVDEIGGGICQVATTVFNCVYEGGYDVITRHNHSLYIASYPDGRDAAVSWPDLDLVWDNDSPSDLLMRTSHTATTVTVELLGVNPNRTVTTEVGPWKAGEKYTKITQTDPEQPKGYKFIKQYGSDGKSITVIRTVKDADGKVIHKDTFTSVYDAMNEITVKGTAK